MKRLWKSSDFQLTSWTRMFSLCCYVPEVMPPTLLCWSTMSEVAVGGMAVDVESSHQYSLTFCCCVTDGNRGAVWQNDVWHGSAYKAKDWNWIPLCGKSGMHWHSLTCWTFMETQQWEWAQWNSEWCISAVVVLTGGHLCWCRFWQAWHAGSCSLLMKMHSQ